MTLNDLKPNESGVITDIRITGRTKCRLIDMGVTVGTRITMLCAAPLGDPVAYSVLGYQLCLRRSETRKIQIERCGNS